MKYKYDRDERELKLIDKECAKLSKEHDGKHYPTNNLGYVTKEWAKQFLSNWNRAVALWDDGHMFKKHYKESDEYKDYQLRDQQEYARICCSWIIPNGFQEPHAVAEGG